MLHVGMEETLVEEGCVMRHTGGLREALHRRDDDYDWRMQATAWQTAVIRLGRRGG